MKGMPGLVAPMARSWDLIRWDQDKKKWKYWHLKPVLAEGDFHSLPRTVSRDIATSDKIFQQARPEEALPSNVSDEGDVDVDQKLKARFQELQHRLDAVSETTSDSDDACTSLGVGFC